MATQPDTAAPSSVCCRRCSRRPRHTDKPVARAPFISRIPTKKRNCSRGNVADAFFCQNPGALSIRPSACHGRPLLRQPLPHPRALQSPAKQERRLPVPSRQAGRQTDVHRQCADPAEADAARLLGRPAVGRVGPLAGLHRFTARQRRGARAGSLEARLWPGSRRSLGSPCQRQRTRLHANWNWPISAAHAGGGSCCVGAAEMGPKPSTPYSTVFSSKQARVQPAAGHDHGPLR